MAARSAQGARLPAALGGLDERGPVAVAGLVHLRPDLRALIEDAGPRLVPGEGDREIEQRFVFDDPARLDAAARGQNDLRLGVVDAGRELPGGEAAEHHRMHGADPRAGEHGDDRLRNHRHIDQHPVARRDPEVVERRGKRRRLVEQFAIGDGAPGRGDRAVVIERDLVAASRLDMPVERVEAGVAARVGEPAAIDARVGIENALRRRYPRDLARRLRPEALRIGAPAIIGPPIAADHRFAPSPPPPTSGARYRARTVARVTSKRNVSSGMARSSRRSREEDECPAKRKSASRRFPRVKAAPDRDESAGDGATIARRSARTA